LTKSNQNDLKIYIKIILKNIYIFRDIIWNSISNNLLEWNNEKVKIFSTTHVSC